MNILKTILLTAVICISANASAQKERAKIVVSANQFVTESGDKIIFRGVSTSDPDKLDTDKLWNKSYFQEIQNWGANIVRFPVHPSAWRKRGKENYLELLKKGISWAEELGLYVIIDWHSIGNLKTGIYLDDRYDTDLKETLNFWKTIVEHFGKNHTVAFYEIFNEPTTNKGKFGNITWEEWREIMHQAIDIIRLNGGEGIPLVAGFNWAYDLTPVKYNPIAADGIGYVSHPYPQKKSKPWEDQWTKDWGFVKDQYPVILTEMGFCDADDPGAHIPVISDESYGDAITDYSDEKDISYVVWVFDIDWAPRMYTDKKYTPSRQGKYFKNRLKSYQK